MESKYTTHMRTHFIESRTVLFGPSLYTPAANHSKHFSAFTPTPLIRPIACTRAPSRFLSIGRLHSWLHLDFFVDWARALVTPWRIFHTHAHACVHVLQLTPSPSFPALHHALLHTSIQNAFLHLLSHPFIQNNHTHVRAFLVFDDKAHASVAPS